MPATESRPTFAGSARSGSTLRRLYASVSPIGLFAILGLVLFYSFGRTVNDSLISMRDGKTLAWLRDTGEEFGGQGLMALVMVALVAPAMSLGPRSGWRRALVLAAAIGFAALVSAMVRIVHVELTMEQLPWMQSVAKYTIRFAVRYGYMATLAVIVVEFYRYEVSNVAAMHDAELDRLALDREMASARLQVLQAQIEPHFLFNTLANVRRLYQTDPTLGRQMLDNLMRYLEVALPRMRDATSTLEREAALIEAFLNVQKIRMGRRLAFEIDIPAELRLLEVPPMMLLTLVENALKHGLNPLPEGGLVRVSASKEAALLHVAVADTGRGLGEGTSGGGTGLANIRARLSAMFGSAASLRLAGNSPRGITATLSFPVASLAGSALAGP